MILNGSYGNNEMCGGGNFIYAAADTALEHIPSMDYESAVPYTSMMDDDVKPSTAPETPYPATEEFNTTPLNPVHFFTTNGSDTYKPLFAFKISASSSTAGLGVETDKVDLVKKLLSKGVLMSARMKSSLDTSFQLFSGGLFSTDAECTGSSDHQVTLAGYGTYDGTPVWLL